jgi:glycolate oxidase FAD binding subunit
VNGHGEGFKAGGKVVKNVTGFDIPKLVCGAFGTLGVLTEVTLRVFPKPETSAVFAVSSDTPERGLALLRRVWSSPLEPTGLAYATADVSMALGLAGDLALIRLEGGRAPLDEKRAALRKLLENHMSLEQEGDEPFVKLGTSVPFTGNMLDVWRIAVPPANAAALVLDLQPALWAADWAGGLLWIGWKESPATVHDTVERHGAHAMLVRASEATRNAIAPFPPLTPERLALTRSVKAAFDPLGLFNPGRMYPGL